MDNKDLKEELEVLVRQKVQLEQEIRTLLKRRLEVVKLPLCKLVVKEELYSYTKDLLDAGYTVQEVAAKVGKSRQTVYDWKSKGLLDL